MGMSKTSLFLIVIYFSIQSICAQSIKGIVLDANTNEPIESASVYFDGTTIGTSTNSKGNFEIRLAEGVISPLIISFLGYQKVMLDEYQSSKFYKILLHEDLNTLDEVVISADDGMTKAEKLKQFRREFLGNTENGKSCSILNESDLILRYNSSKKQLTASARRPILVQNDNLEYLISFDLQDFVIEYNYVDLLKNHYGIHSVIYLGTSFYTDQDSLNSRKIIKKRDKAYEGSHLHFMRALSKKSLNEEGYKIFDGRFEVPPYKFITVEPVENSQNVRVTVEKPLSILYDKKLQSAMQVNGENFIIDQYGNYAPIPNVLFGGDIGNQRLGDALPFDYQLLDSE